jgi:hypothetical protein
MWPSWAQWRCRIPQKLALWTKQHMLLRCQAIKWCPAGWSLFYRCKSNLRVPPNYQDRYFSNSNSFSLSSVSRSLDPGVANLEGEVHRWRCTQMTAPSCNCRVPRLQLFEAKIPLVKSISGFCYSMFLLSLHVKLTVFLKDPDVWVVRPVNVLHSFETGVPTSVGGK